MPRKTFVAGEVLAAADVNTYLMDQAVMTFAGSAARGSAIASPSEGMVSYLEDTDSVEVYDSTNWIAVGGSQTGNVIQVVSTTKTDTFTTSSTSFVDVTGLTATITPQFSTSKILVMAQISISGSNNLGLGHFKLAGGNTSSYVGAAAGSRVQAVFGGYTAADTDDFLMSHILQYLDSPATTSATTYSVQARQAFNGAVWVNRTVTDSDSVLYPRGASTITLMEIAG